ncbi:MAG: hypothetical protein EXX96DRAFT_636292 [Benjaminiella poitrasii]|nr:MAG: hypothetical protein EXX96DRAFT_636292 [Benjaminiella poitrasii]
MLSDACESNNLLHIHTTQILTYVLPIFINDPPDYFIEDGHVHNYVSPLLATIFGSDPLLNIEWVNGQLKTMILKHTNRTFWFTIFSIERYRQEDLYFSKSIFIQTPKHNS